jgi:hypothetical protein
MENALSAMYWPGRRQSTLTEIYAEDSVQLSDSGSTVGVVHGGHAEFGCWREVRGNPINQHASAEGRPSFSSQWPQRIARAASSQRTSRRARCPTSW